MKRLVFAGLVCVGVVFSCFGSNAYASTNGVAAMPFFEGFEAGSLEPYWTVRGTAEYRTQVTSANIPASGLYHLTMDDSVSGGFYSRNELTLDIDLANYENVALNFWAKDFGDEPHGPPMIPFTNSADFDGVAISEDGVLWYEVQGLRNEVTATYSLFTVDLDAAIALHGLSYNSMFRIRFNQYDNFSIATDGIAIDEITISGTVGDSLLINPGNGFSASGHPGGSFSPSGMDYALTNNSGSSLTWSAIADEPWVVVVPSGGTISAGAPTLVAVGLSPATDQLAEGSYTNTITFSNLTSGVAQTRDVYLNVFTAPEIHVNPMSGFVVTNKVGQQQNRTLVISNAAVADGNLDFDVGTLGTGLDGVSSLAAEEITEPSPEHDFTTIPPDAEYKPGYLLVRWLEESPLASQNAIVSDMGDKVTSRYESVPGLCLVELAEDTTIEEALASYNSAAGVLYAQPDYVWHIDRMPDDTLLNDLWGMHNTGQTGGTSDADIDAPEAWEVATGSSEIVVAVIDTGVDYNHPDLNDNMWVNTGEIPGNNLDDDGNGYIDDIYGYDFVNNDGDPLDDHYHGTHCAGTIGAEGDNAVGVVGVCWDVRIMALKFLDSNGSGSTANAIASIEYAMQMGAKVLSNSWGGDGYDQALKDAIDAAGVLGIPFVAAAGNDGTNNDSTPHYPSNYDSENIISVVSSDHDDARSSFSNYGVVSTDLAAPGSSVLSCRPGGTYQYLNGTSMATPHVAGACALMLSVNPGLTSAEIKQILVDTVDPTLPGTCASGGRLNLANAVAESGVPWISVSPENGRGLVPGDSMNITVSFDAMDVVVGTHNGEITIASNDPLSPNVEVPIQMYVEPDDLMVSPQGAFEASGVIGGPFSPASVEYALTNNGAEMLDWTVANSEAWVSISSTNGSLAAGAATSVMVSINNGANWLSAGEYEDQIIFSNLVSGARQAHEAKLDIAFPPPVSIYSFQMDSDLRWTTEGQWEFGQPAGVGGDPASGHTGLNVYGYNLAGQYPNRMPKYWLTTTALDCSGYTNITLQFQRWLGVESSSFDHADIKVSNDGSTWQTVWSHTGGSFSDTSWQEVSYDISSVADDEASVYIRWGMGTTDGSVTYCGWNIDDVEILGNQGSVLFMDLPDQATEGDGILALAGTVYASSPPASNLVINLTSSDSMDAGITNSVIILAGHTNATFDVVIHDDSLLEGSQTITFTATADGYAKGTSAMEVHDNETATLSLSLPGSTFEGAGSIGGALMLNAVPAKDVVVSLISNDPSEIGSTNVTISAGLNIALFDLSVINDNLIDGIQSATITAHVQNWTDGVGSIFVQDNESASLTVQLPPMAGEGDGVLTNAGVVSLSGIVSSDVHVVLTCSDTSEVSVPVFVTVPAGQLNSTFDVSVIDDSETDGTQNLSVVGNSPRFVPGFDVMSISDNDLHHFSVGSVDSQQVAGVSFNLVVTAENIENAAIVMFNGSPALSALGDAGAVVVVPATLAFESGQWSGDVSIDEISDSVVLLVDDGTGHSGTSSVFNVTGAQITITPDSLANTLVVAGETLVRTMVVSNAGNTDLEFEIQSLYSERGSTALATEEVVKATGTELFKDGFEDGNFNEWTVSGSSIITPSVTTSTAAEGAYSFSITSGYDHRKGVYQNILGVAPDRIDFYVRTSNTSPANGYFVIGDGTAFSDTAIFFYISEGTMKVADNASDVPCVTGQWYKISFLIDWSTKRFDFLVDDAVKHTNLRFRSDTVNEISRIDLYNYQSATAWWDGIRFSTAESDGLVAHFPFNGNADDESGNGHNGTVNGATLTTDRFGNADSAYMFNGTDDYIAVPDSTDLRLSQTDFTISTWFYEESRTTPAVKSLITKRLGQYEKGWLYAVVDGASYYQVSGGYDPRAVSPNPVSVNAWNHSVVTYDLATTTIRLYINGILDSVHANIPSPNATAASMMIGRDSELGRYWFHGVIDDIRMYNRMLSTDEVFALYQDDGLRDSWLSVNPETGTVPPGSNAMVDVQFDASGFEVGDYSNAVLSITCNDVLSPSNSVPVSMWVKPTAPTMVAEPEFTLGTSNGVAWSRVDGPVSYLTEIMDNTNSAPLQQSGWIASTNHTFYSLTTNVVYYYHVKASVSSGIGLLEGAWSDWVRSEQVADLSDFDGDGLPNWWEQLYFDGTRSGQPLVDTDGDGQINRDEFIAGMDPTDPYSSFMVRTFDPASNGMFVLSWDSVTGRVYSVSWSTNMPSSFQTLETEIRHPQNSYTDSVHNAESQGFYRIGVELE